MTLTMHHLAYPVTSLGPGRRVVVWTAGCSRRCPSCITPDLLTSQAGRPVPVETLAQRILSIPLSLDGITLTGGDPADQAEAVIALLSQLRYARPNWNILLYTGYTRRQLLEHQDVRTQLLGMVDVLIDGPYRQDVAPTHPLTGSGNQQLHALTSEGEIMLSKMAVPTSSFNIGIAGECKGEWLIGVSNSHARRKVHNDLSLSRRANGSE